MKFMVTLILLIVLKSNAGQDGGGNYAFHYGSERIAKQLFEDLGYLEGFSTTFASTNLISEFNKAQTKYYPDMKTKEAQKIYGQFDSALTGYSIDRLAKLNQGSSNWFHILDGKIIVTTGFLQHFDRLNKSINVCEQLSLLTNLFTTAFGNTSLTNSMQKRFGSEMARQWQLHKTGQYPNCTADQLLPVSLPYKTCNRMTNEEVTYSRDNLLRGQQELIEKLEKPWAQDLLNRASMLVFSPHKINEISVQLLVDIVKNIEVRPCQRVEATKRNFWESPQKPTPYLLTMDFRLNEHKITVLEPFFSLYRTKDLSESNLEKIQIELLHEALHVLDVGTYESGLTDHGSRRLAKSFVLKGELPFLPCGRQGTLTENLIDCKTSLETAKSYGIRNISPIEGSDWKLLEVKGTLNMDLGKSASPYLSEDIYGYGVNLYDVYTAYINMNSKFVVAVGSVLKSLIEPNKPIGKILERGPIYTSANNSKFATYSSDIADCQRWGRKFGLKDFGPPTGRNGSSEISEVLNFHYNNIWALNASIKWPRNSFEWEWNYEAPLRYATWLPEVSSTRLLYDLSDNSVHSMDYFTNNNSLGLGQVVCIGTN